MVVFYQILEWLFSIVFILSAVLLIIVILLQEGRGGGIAEAFGGAGGETFGVRASGIARFTGWVAFFFIATALLIPIAQRQISAERDPFREEPKKEAPPLKDEPKNEVTPPPKDGGEKPKDEGGGEKKNG